MGASIPIVGATITLYAAGTTGYGSAPTVIGQGRTVTDSNGYFTINRVATCTDPQQLYIVSSGGSQAGVANAKIVTLEALGTCSTITSSTYVIINEATTVAAAYALSGFAKVDGSSVNIGTSSTNVSGLVHAFANANNLVTQVGYARGVTPGGNGTPPYAMVNTLANALVACVDSNGSTGACSNIAVAPPTGTTTGTPTNAWQIALNWALYPNYNVANVYNNQVAPYFFLPHLTAQPSDLSVAITYTAGVQSDGTTAAKAPVDVKADGNGNIWLSGMTGAPLVELGADGSVLSPAGGHGNSALKGASLSGIAIDANSSTVWAADTGGNVFSFQPASSTTAQFALPSSITYNGQSVATPSRHANVLAIDGSGNIWYSVGGTSGTSINYVGEIMNASDGFGVQSSYTSNPFYPGTSSGGFFTGINNRSGAYTTNALVTNNDSAGNGDYRSASVQDLTDTGSTGQGKSTGISYDSSGNLWMVGTGNNGLGGSLCKFTTFSSNTCFTGPKVGSVRGLTAPTGMITDGSGRFFIASNTIPAAVLEYDTSAGFLATSTGYGFSPVDSNGASTLSSGNLNNLTIDTAGAIWVANSTSSASPVVQILGPGAPTIGPVSNGYAARP